MLLLLGMFWGDRAPAPPEPSYDVAYPLFSLQQIPKELLTEDTWLIVNLRRAVFFNGVDGQQRLQPANPELAPWLKELDSAGVKTMAVANYPPDQIDAWLLLLRSFDYKFSLNTTAPARNTSDHRPAATFQSGVLLVGPERFISLEWGPWLRDHFDYKRPKLVLYVDNHTSEVGAMLFACRQLSIPAVGFRYHSPEDSDYPCFARTVLPEERPLQ